MRQLKILFIEPPAVSRFGNQRIWGGNGSNKSHFKKPPHDLMAMCGYLRKKGIESDLIDANAAEHTIEDVQKIIQEKNYDVIFYSTSTCTIHKDHLIGKVAKEHNPKTFVACVGTHVMALPDEAFRDSPWLDAMIYSAEWEQCTYNIIDNLHDLDQAKGIYYRKTDGSIVKTAPQENIMDYDSLGWPAHDKLKASLYGDPTSRRFPKTMVQAQKACINSCSFCCQPAFFGKKVKKRSIPDFINELKWVQELGFKEVMINDATLTGDMKWAKKLFEAMIEAKIDLTWNCTTRVERVNDELLELMKKAGCHTVCMGLESTDEVILKNIKKNTDQNEVHEAVRLVRKHGMDTVLFCVVGFPGETHQTIKNTIKFLKSIDTTFITLGIAVPAPGTEFFRHLDENGYLHHKDWSKYDPMQAPVFSYPNLSSEDIAFYSRYGLKQFYLRPTYIWRRLKTIRSVHEVKMYATNFFGFVRRYVLNQARVTE